MSVTVLTFAERGFRLIGFDIDAKKVEALLARRSYIHHIDKKRIAVVVVFAFQINHGLSLHV